MVCRRVIWTKLDRGWFKLNTDVCSKRNPGGAAIDVILRDSQGNAIFPYNGYIGQCTSVQAELHAVVKGLQISIARGIRRIRLEMDSMVVVYML